MVQSYGIEHSIALLYRTVRVDKRVEALITIKTMPLNVLTQEKLRKPAVNTNIPNQTLLDIKWTNN